MAWRVDDRNDLVRAYEALSVYEKLAENHLGPGASIPHEGWSPEETYDIVYKVLKCVPDVPAIYLINLIHVSGLKQTKHLPIPESHAARAQNCRPFRWNSGKFYIPYEEGYPPYIGRSSCGLCGKIAKTVDDHCHMSHRFRGKLCPSCNTRVSAITSPEWILRARPESEPYHTKKSKLSKKTRLQIDRVWTIYDELRQNFPQLPDSSAFDVRLQSEGEKPLNIRSDDPNNFSSRDDLIDLIEEVISASKMKIKLYEYDKGRVFEKIILHDEKNRALLIENPWDYPGICRVYEKPLEGHLPHPIKGHPSDHAEWKEVDRCGHRSLKRYLSSWSAGRNLRVKPHDPTYDLVETPMVKMTIDVARKLYNRKDLAECDTSSDYAAALVDMVARMSGWEEKRRMYPDHVAAYVLDQKLKEYPSTNDVLDELMDEIKME